MHSTIVTYTPKDDYAESEKKYGCLKEAISFADGIIEDGGSADISTDEPRCSSYNYALCTIYFDAD